MAELSESAFLSKWATLFADNTTRLISEEDMRDFRQDVADSFLNVTDDLLDEDDMASDSATKVPSQQSVKAYVDAEVAGLGSGIVESIVAGTNITVDATDPANPIVNSTASGGTWGSITGTLSSQTDLQAALDAKFTTADASETVKGIIEIATQAETNTGTDDVRALTPLKAATRYAPLASPALTGTPTAPTAAAGTSTTQLATTAFVSGELGFSFVSITGAITLDSTAFGKMHICTGTVSAYTIGLPTAVGNENKSIAFKGDADGLTVNVTIDGNSGETIDDEDSRQFNAGGLFVILSDGTNWHIVAEVGSWVTYTPVWTGLSADPVMSEAKYWRTGKNCIVQFRSGTDGTSNATTKTITFPFNAYSVIQFASITSVRNNGTTQAGPGYLQTRANSNVVDLFRDAASLAWTASGGFRASGTITYQVE